MKNCNRFLSIVNIDVLCNKCILVIKYLNYILKFSGDYCLCLNMFIKK